MAVYPLHELIGFVRNHSEYYEKLYKGLPSTLKNLADLPVVDQQDFWRANTFTNSKLLTSEVTDAIIFRSGGTTGAPKFSVFTREEWTAFTHYFGQGLAAGGMKPGERVANVFYGGGLYASFLFIYKSLEQSPTPNVHLPISGSTSIPDILPILSDFNAETLAGVPTSILSILETYQKHRNTYPSLHLKRVLFGGESMHKDQRAFLNELFPGIQIHSIGYASVDAGLLGYADPSCDVDVHRAFSEATVLEILDEDNNTPITTTQTPGRLVITNLTRKLMPIIRYPVGDKAMWLDAPSTHDPRFQLLGRTEEAARIGPVSFYYSDMENILSSFKESLSWSGFQLEIYHKDGKDGLIVRLATTDPSQIPSQLQQQVLAELHLQRPMLKECSLSGKIHSTYIELVTPSQLSVNQRTGKLRRVIDLRY